MEPSGTKTLIRLRLSLASLGLLKERAVAGGLPAGKYAEKVLHYASRADTPGRGRTTAPAVMDEVYFTIPVAGSMKRRILEQSARMQANLAAYGGLLIELFLRKSETDPRDFQLIHELSVLLDERTVIGEEDLRRLVNRARKDGGAELSAGYLSRWLYTRLRPLLVSVEREGVAVELSPELIERWLK